MSLRLMGRKEGMTQLFDKDGNLVVCTVISIEPNIIAQIKTKERDGYEAIQLGFGFVKDERADKRFKILTKAQRGHYQKNDLPAKRHLHEARLDSTAEYSLGQAIDVSIFEEGSYIDVSGTSKGKGYQGVMKKYNFRGGPAAHGSSFHRHAGSTGMRSTPGICFKGGKRASRMGGDNKTVQNLLVFQVDKDNHLLIVRGAIPGPKGETVIVRAAVKKHPVNVKK